MVAPPSATTPEHRQVPVTGNPTKGGRSFAIAKRDPTGRLGTTLTVTVTDGHVVASASPIGSVLMVSPSADMGDGPVDPDHPIRLGPSPCPSASGYPAGTPVRGPPARGPPRGAPGGNFRARGPPARGPPGAPPGGPKWPPGQGPRMGPIRGLYYYISIFSWGVQGGTPLGAFLGPRAPGGPGGQKVHIFLGI